jgi:hypothetical protein
VASDSPALASFNDQLYLAYPTVDASGNPQVCYRSGGSPGSSGGFSSANQTCLPNTPIVGTPSLTASDSTLWLAFRRTDTSGVWVIGLLGTRQGETHQLSSGSIIITGDPGVITIMGSPSVADFNGQPYVCFSAVIGPLLNKVQCDGLDGTTAVIPTVIARASPAVTTFNGQFYLVHQAAGLFVNYSLWYTTSSNPTSQLAWSLDMDMGIGHVVGSPTVEVYHNKLYWAAQTDNQQVLFGAIGP